MSPNSLLSGKTAPFENTCIKFDGEKLYLPFFLKFSFIYYSDKNEF